MSWNVWNRPSGSFMVDMGISLNIMNSPSPKCYMTFLDMTIYIDTLNVPRNAYWQLFSKPDATWKIATILVKESFNKFLKSSETILWHMFDRYKSFCLSCLFWVETPFCFRIHRFARKLISTTRFKMNKDEVSCVSLFYTQYQNTDSFKLLYLSARKLFLNILQIYTKHDLELWLSVDYQKLQFNFRLVGTLLLQ